VCALQWSAHDKELVSSHGYSHNQLILWKYPSMVRVAELTGHTSRVLHMAQSPDGTTVCTAAGPPPRSLEPTAPSACCPPDTREAHAAACVARSRRDAALLEDPERWLTAGADAGRRGA
jgi:hypothetical protein